MTVRRLGDSADLERYNTWVKTHPHGSLWQSPEWKRYQESLGRETRIYVEEGGGEIAASALVVIDRTSFGLSVWDVPRGPLIAGSEERRADSLLETIVEDAQHDRALSIYLSPLRPLPATRYPLPASQRHEQPSATRVIDLTQSEEKILSEMKPKGRYNIHVAQKHNVRVSESKDIDVFYALLEETAHRDGFATKPKTHYKNFLTDLQGSFLLLASCTQNPPTPTPTPNPNAIAALLGAVWPGSAGATPRQGIYYYGASKYAERAKMAPYLLQWEAMRMCKERGCEAYDLLGISPPTNHQPPLKLPVAARPRRDGRPASESRLPPEARNAKVGITNHESHPWMGVSAFKEKFGGTVVTYPREKQIVLRPMTLWLLNMKRKLWR